MSLARTFARLTLPLLMMAALLGWPAASAVAAGAAWTPVPSPWSAGAVVDDLATFGTAGLALVGDEGRIYLTRNAGASWDVIVPAGQQATVFTAVALNASGDGVVASGGLLLVTADGGRTWRPPTYGDGGRPTSVNDLAMRGSRAVAVCDGGVIMESSDGAQSWSRAVSPTTRDLTAVAIAGDGTAVAGGSGGEVLVGSGGAWTLAAVAPGPVTSVAASATPAWGDGTPDLFAAAGAGVLGSDDAVLFAPLSGIPDLTQLGTPQLAWAGVPSPSLLVAAGGQAGFSLPATGAWRPVDPGVQQALRAAAPGGQSVAYVLGTSGLLVRTLSAGLDPASLVAGRDRLTVGQSTRLRAAVSIGARGTLRLRARLPRGRWQTLRSVDWRASDWGREVTFAASPSFNREYRLEFVYGRVTTRVTPVTTIVVTPRIATARSRYDLRVGDIFRFSGTVTPILGGERVELLTDRGGSWRPVSGSALVRLSDGHTWTSRAFGTPEAETYRMRAHMRATAKHAEAWSRIVTVTIRR